MRRGFFIVPQHPDLGHHSCIQVGKVAWAGFILCCYVAVRSARERSGRVARLFYLGWDYDGSLNGASMFDRMCSRVDLER